MNTIIDKNLLNKCISTSQADDLLYDNESIRVWKCRVTGQYSAENLVNGRWKLVPCVEKSDSVQVGMYID